MKTLPQTSLKSFHTFGLDVQAEKIIQADTVQDFIQIWEDYSKEPKLLVGEGSNLLFCENFEGIIILNRLKGIALNETDSAWHLQVAGGENWHDLVCWTLDNGMHGLENLALIPGLTGSAPIQNIGAYGVEFKDRCEYVDVLMLETGEVRRFSCDECEFGYRDSVFKRQLKEDTIIVSVGLILPKSGLSNLEYGPLAQLKKNPHLTPKDVFDKVCEIRKEKLPDPLLMGNAGSFFKNPIVSQLTAKMLKEKYPKMPCYEISETEVKLAAGWLIEAAGLKGRAFGGAAVHDKQALVLVNKNSATALDVISLARIVVETVLRQFNVELEHEVRFIDKNKETCLASL